MISLDRYSSFKRRIEQLKRERDQAQGAANEHLRRLQQEFSCASLESAKKLLLKRRKNLQCLEQELQEETKRVMRDFPDALGD